jgi:hypothetical protein
MEMEHPGIVALICAALLIWVRSTVPNDKRTRLELRLLKAWHGTTIAVLKQIMGWLRR